MIDGAGSQGDGEHCKPIAGCGGGNALGAAIRPENGRSCRCRTDPDGIIVFICLCELSVDVDDSIGRIGEGGISCPTAAINALQRGCR